MAKPGVMFYFDIRPCLKRLNTEEKGQLFEAILDYGEFGKEPDFGGMVGVAWDFIKPSIDRDAGRYEKLVLQKQYAAYARETKKRNQIPVSFEEWKLMDDNERYRLISDDTGRHPTTTTTPSTSSTNNLQQPTKEGAGKPPKARVNDPGFDKFWSAYPKKVGKKEAKKAFAKVRVPVDILITAINQQKRSKQWTKDNGQYIPNPSTWLNQCRWDDELEANTLMAPVGVKYRLDEEI